MGKNKYREHLESIFRAGLEAVDPMEAVAKAVSRDGGELLVAGRSYRLEDYERIFVIGAGKAGAPMASAMEEILGDRLTSGRITVKYGHTVPLKKVETKEAGHPIPDEEGIAGRRGNIEYREPGRGEGSRLLRDLGRGVRPARSAGGGHHP